MFSREPPEHYKQNGDVPNFISERCFWQPIGSWKEAKVRVWKTGDLGRDSCGEERKWRQKDAREEFGEGRKKRDQRLKKLSGRWRRTLAGRQSGFGVDMMNLVTWARAGGGWSPEEGCRVLMTGVLSDAMESCMWTFRQRALTRHLES